MTGWSAPIESLLLLEHYGVSACSRQVARYFFDTRDDGSFVQDENGLDLADLEAVKAQAALALAEMARDVLPGSTKRELSVEVRDERQPILRAVMTFEVVVLGE